MERLRKNNIILIGFMGSGKTSVGTLLADGMKYRFLDTDRLLEQKEKQTIPEMFEYKGEAYFRDKESKLLEELSYSLEETVLSTGGGIPLREQNRKLLKEMGFVVFLQASNETTVERLRGDTTRPILAGEELEKKVEHLQRERMPIYTVTAHYAINTDNLSPEEIAEEIMVEYRRQLEKNSDF